MEYFLLGIILLLILFAELVNGWTDAPNAIATVVSTRTLSPRVAILLAMVFNVIGAFSGTAVATTIGTGIIRPEVMNLLTLGSAMIAVITWGMIAWAFGLPISKSHALIAGISGAGLFAGGPSALIWDGWIKVFLGLILSTFLGGSSGWILAKMLSLCFSHLSPSRGRLIFGKLQMVSSSLMALSHGSNDGQKFIGVFSLALLLGGISTTFHVPFWVVILCAIVMGLGTSIGGMRIIKTMGFKIIHLEVYQGFAAETAATFTILLASFFGIPLSTTHTINTSIVGIGLAKQGKRVRWKVVINIVLAWILTFPFCGLLAFVISWLVTLINAMISDFQFEFISPVLLPRFAS